MNNRLYSFTRYQLYEKFRFSIYSQLGIYKSFVIIYVRTRILEAYFIILMIRIKIQFQISIRIECLNGRNHEDQNKHDVKYQ